MTSGLAAVAHIMLGLAVLAPGCSASKVPPTAAHRDDRAMMNAAPAEANGQGPRNVGRTERQPSSPAVRPAPHDPEARARDVQPTATPIYTDPGAAWVVEQLVDAVRASEEGVATADVPLRISVTGIGNQSRAQTDEFEGMLERLAELLSRAGRDEHVTFTADPAAPAQYRLKGTAYLLHAAGFDQWELYLSLSPSDHAWTVWSSDVPVRMLRATRPRSQQIFPLEQPRR